MMWGNNYWSTGFPNLGLFFTLWPFIMIIAVVEIVLKGYALWFASKREQKGWFIALLILNTLGILPLIYILLYKDKKVKKSR
ncbi:MAG TPA: DUF5652 family protein [Patescibacteria group bacterium]